MEHDQTAKTITDTAQDKQDIICNDAAESRTNRNESNPVFTTLCIQLSGSLISMISEGGRKVQTISFVFPKYT